MTIFKRNWFIIMLLMPFFFVSLNCGGIGNFGDDSVSFDNPNNREFQLWLQEMPGDPLGWPQWWNEVEIKKHNWKAVWKLPYSSAFEVWQRKEFNCKGCCILLKTKYPYGKIFYIDQSEVANYNHVVFLINGWIITAGGLKVEKFEGWENYPYYYREITEEELLEMEVR